MFAFLLHKTALTHPPGQRGTPAFSSFSLSSPECHLCSQLPVAWFVVSCQLALRRACSLTPAVKGKLSGQVLMVSVAVAARVASSEGSYFGRASIFDGKPEPTPASHPDSNTVLPPASCPKLYFSSNVPFFVCHLPNMDIFSCE